jgi:hypothetical protein
VDHLQIRLRDTVIAAKIEEAIEIASKEFKVAPKGG